MIDHYSEIDVCEFLICPPPHVMWKAGQWPFEEISCSEG